MFNLLVFSLYFNYCNSFKSEASNSLFSETRDEDSFGKYGESQRNNKHVNSLSRPRPKDIFDHSPIFSFNRFSSALGDGLEYCKMPAKCVPLKYSTCMGVKLPYNHTSLDLVEGLSSQEQAQVRVINCLFSNSAHFPLHFLSQLVSTTK